MQCMVPTINSEKKFQKEKIRALFFVGLILRLFLCVVSAFSMFVGIVVHFAE